VTSVDIKVGLSRSAVGAHARALMDAGMIIKDQDNGWHIANDFIVEIEPKKVTPIDIADDFIRKMIDVK
jgi:DNA-binding transcriptional ArsR family regulator